MAVLELNTTASVPDGATLYVTVEEDPDGDGIFENAATTTVPDGVNTQSVSGFDGADGNDTRIYIERITGTSDGDVSLSSATLQADTGVRTVTGDLRADTTLGADVLGAARLADGDADVESALDADITTGPISTSGDLDAETTTDATIDTGPVSTSGDLDAETSAADSAAEPVQASFTTIETTLGGDARAAVGADLDAETAADADVQVVQDAAADLDAETTVDGDVSAVQSVAGTLDAETTADADVQATQSVEAGLAAETTLGGPAEGVVAADASATTSLGGDAVPTVAADMDAAATLAGDIDSRQSITTNLDAETTTDADASAPSFDVVGDADVESSLDGLLEADQLTSVTATENADGTITVDWAVSTRSRANSAFKIDERVNGLGWVEVATVDDPDARSYTTDPLPDRAETFEYRVRGIAAGRVSDTLAADEKFWAQESSIRSVDYRSRAAETYATTVPSGESPGEIDVPKVVSTGWQDTQTRNSNTVPTEAVAGEGTALRIIADQFGRVDADGDPLGTGNEDWEFGVPQTFDGQFTPDTDVDWPVTIKQTFALQISDPKYLEEIDSFATSAGECSVKTKITNIRTVGKNILFTLEIVLDCPPGTGSSNFSGGFTPKPTEDAPEEAPEGPPRPGPPRTGGEGTVGGGGGGGGSTDWDAPFPYARGVNVSNACVPQGTQGAVPVNIVMESAAVDAYDFHFSYDPDVIRVTGATAGRMAPTVEDNDTENGYLHLSSSAGSAISFSPYAEDKSNTASFIEYEVLADDGSSTEIEMLPRSKALRDGEEVYKTSYRGGNVEVGGGYTLPSESVGFGQTEEYTVGTETGVPVTTADVVLTFPAGPVTIQAVKSTGDMNVTDWDIPEPGVLEVDSDAATAVRDPDLFTIEFEGYTPEGPGDIRFAADNEVAIDGALSTLRDTLGQVIETPCSYTGSMSVTGNIDAPTGRGGDGDGGIEIPEIGVVYWPIYLPITLRLDEINTDVVTEKLVQVLFTSNTNDPQWVVNDVVIGPEEAPNSVFIDVGVVLPKADPQEYPVDLNGKVWFGLSTAGRGGDGLLAGPPAYLGGGSGGLNISINIGQLGGGSGGDGLSF